MKLPEQHRAQRSACLESLERRVLMDGDVRATFRGGDLSVRGDDGDNRVVITQPSPKTARVLGLDDTLINGRGFVDFPYAVDDVRVDMRQGGEDQVEIQGAIKILGGVTARLGEGEFVLEGSAGPVEVAENVKVRSRNGDVHLRNEVIVNGGVDISTGGAVSAAAKRGFLPDFPAARFSDSLNIDNPYFPLLPGTTYTYEEKSVDDETGETITETIVIEVTNETRTILGVVNRVLRDRVFVDGLLIEDTRDWHAQDDLGNVWYFGEESTDFEYDDEGNLIGTSTETSWEAGVDGAKPGIIMQARPRVGDAYYQEFEPGVALDQGEVLATDERVTISFGTFNDMVRTKDTSVLSPGSLEHKTYAPGLGLIQELTYDIQTGEVDGVLRLVSAERNGQPITQVVLPDGFNGVNATGESTGPLTVRGETLIRAGGSVVVTGTRFADELEVFGESDVTLLDSILDDLTVETEESVALRNLNVGEEVFVRAGGNAYVFASRFATDVELRLGDGDDELVIENSSLAKLEADGGPGEDTFDDVGGNSIDEVILRRFEEQ